MLVTLLIAFILLIVIGLFAIVLNRADRDDVVADTLVIIRDAQDLSIFEDTFPLTELQLQALSDCSEEDKEDEAASLAMFCGYDYLHELHEGHTIEVVTPLNRVYVFKPTFEEGHLIGVELIEPNSHIDSTSTAK